VFSLRAILDELDKKIVHFICGGVYSYTELAKLCRVGRNTIYRRINRLEKLGVINKRIMAIPNFTKLNLSAIGVMMDVSQADVNRTISLLQELPQVKFLWKTYGTHNITAVMVCERGDEGQSIFSLREVLEKLKVRTKKFDASVSFTWEKVDLTPY